MAKETGQIVSFAEFRRHKRASEPTARSHSGHQLHSRTSKKYRSTDRDPPLPRGKKRIFERAAPLLPAADPAALLAGDKPPSPERLLQSGVLAYRRTKKGELLILLVRKRRSKQWGIPKGKVEAHLSFGENAAKEAFEEAGVRGSISADSVGMFRATKRSPSRLGTRVIEVWVYLLEVTECLSRWPEKGKRQTKWLPCEAAAAALREPVLVDLCHRLAQR
ncbi:MAG TPA: NUDIX hydrolase [Stellaceae bacterium]|nr:NUDIX hydrolase [Stellaceae bacterium]